MLLLVVASAREGGDDDEETPPAAAPPSACEQAAPVDLPDLEASPDTPFDISAPNEVPSSCRQLALEIFPSSRAEVDQTAERQWRASLPTGVYDYELLSGESSSGRGGQAPLSLGQGSIYVTDNQEAVQLHDGLRSMMEQVEVTAPDQPLDLQRGEEAEFSLDINIPAVEANPQTDRIVSIRTCTRLPGGDLRSPECAERSVTVGSGDQWEQPITLVAGEGDRIALNVEISAKAQVGDVDLTTSTVTPLPVIDVRTTLWQTVSAGWSGAIGLLGGVMTLVGAASGARELTQRVRRQPRSSQTPG